MEVAAAKRLMIDAGSDAGALTWRVVGSVIVCVIQRGGSCSKLKLRDERA